jgi:hypothetical protein
MAAVASMAFPSTKSSKFQLISLLKGCVQHLEQSDDEYSTIIVQTSNKLNEYADMQAKLLQTQLLQLTEERDLAIKQTKALQKEQKSRANVELGNSQASATSVVAANPKLSAFEQQKRDATQKRRQQVIDQRRKAALEQKRKEEEQNRKFLDNEQRKEQLKAEAAEQAAQNKSNASLTQEHRIQQNAMSELDNFGGKSSLEKQEEQPQVPMPPSPIQRKTSSPMTSPSPTQRSISDGSSTSHVKIPDISAVRPPPPRAPALAQPQAPSPSLSVQQEGHPPSGSGRKYSAMSQGNTTANETQEESPSFDTTELKREILLQWGLQPPDFQTLKRIDQLVATIQNVYPPFSGVSAHSYFDGWQAVNTADFIRYGENGIAELDVDNVKKAVRRVRIFLHPDKLPRDFTEAQFFVCKLLWDVTSDALEDFKAAEAARRGT